MARTTIDYGKYLYEYVSEIHNEWTYGKNYTVLELKEALREKILKGSPKKIDISVKKPATFNTQPLIYIINEKSRQSFRVKHPSSEDKYNLFYYPQKEQYGLILEARIIRKLNKKNPPKGIKVYWGSSQNPPKKQGFISELI